MVLKIVCVLLSPLLLVTSFSGCQRIEWVLIQRKVQRDFPAVRSITTNQLADWLANPKEKTPLLLDVRTPEEFEVSHLKEAQRVDPDASASSINVPKNTPIVTYCSVGYRSAALAQTLTNAGYTDVRNLRGSIFQWANEDRPLYHAGKRTKLVHPFNQTWGKLLNPDHRANVPPAG